MFESLDSTVAPTLVADMLDDISGFVSQQLLDYVAQVSDNLVVAQEEFMQEEISNARSVVQHTSNLLGVKRVSTAEDDSDNTTGTSKRRKNTIEC